MNLQDFNTKVSGIQAEVTRLQEIVNTPERILSEFFDPYKPNLLLKIFEFGGYTEDELYTVLIDQLCRLEVLSNCRISRKEGAGPNIPLLISFRSPEFSLMVIDIKGKKYENVFESVVRGMSFNISDAKAKRDKAQENVDETKEIDRSIRQIADGDLELRRRGAFGKKAMIRKYLHGLTYSKDTVEAIVRDLNGFLVNCKKEIDIRQATLAKAEAEYAHHCGQKRDYDENPYLQNTIQDLTAILKKCGYEQKDDI